MRQPPPALLHFCFCYNSVRSQYVTANAICKRKYKKQILYSLVHLFSCPLLSLSAFRPCFHLEGLKKVIDRTAIHNEAHAHLVFSLRILLPGVMKGVGGIQDTIPFHLVSKHCVLCLKMLINLGNKLLQYSYSTSFQEKANVIRKEATVGKSQGP